SATVSIAAVGNRTSVSTHSSSSNSTLDGTNHSRGEMAPGKAQHRALVSSIHSQAVNETLPPQTINGIYCRGSRSAETIPAHTFGTDGEIKTRSERWYWDDRQVLVKTTNSAPRFGVPSYELTNIVQAPPAPGFFQFPADFTASASRSIGGGFPNQK